MRLPPFAKSLEDRVRMTASCRDSDAIPKVPEAGHVVEDGGGRRVQIMHNGLRVVADGYYGAWTTDLIRELRGHHEPQEEAVFHEVVRRLPPDATMIELGGYWAYYTLWFMKGAPGRRALVMEPDPAHLRVGIQNAQLNGLRPLFAQGFAGRTSADALPFRTDSGGEVAVPRVSLPDLLQRLGWARVNLLHLDIQGAEFDVLAGGAESLRAGLVDWLFVSTHLLAGDSLVHQRCLDLLLSLGATIEAEHDVHESFSGDGLIVARFCPAPADWTPVKLSYNRHSQSLFRSLAYELAACRQEIALLRAELAGKAVPPAGGEHVRG